MIDLIFNERSDADKPGVSVLGFSPAYRKMICAVIGADFNICEKDPHIIIAEEGVALSCQNTPAIILGTVDGEEKNKLYLSRPVQLERLRQLALNMVKKEKAVEKTTFEVYINEGEHSVSYGGQTVRLTVLEFQLFNILYRSEKAVSRQAIRAELWPTSEDTNICDVYICYLRKKLESLFGKGFIVSERGKGYLLRLPQKHIGN